MECFRCKFYKSGATSNSCSLFECEYFRPFTKESPCTVVSEDYIATEDVEAFGIVKGENLLLRQTTMY